MRRGGSEEYIHHMMSITQARFRTLKNIINWVTLENKKELNKGLIIKEY